MKTFKNDKKIYNRKVLTAKAYRSVFVSSLITLSISNVTYLIEGMFIGAFLDSDALTVYGIGSTFGSICYICSSLFMAGLQLVVIDLIARGKTNKAQQVFMTCVVVICIVVAACIFSTIIFSDTFAWCFGAREEAEYLLNDVSNYLKILAFSCFADVFIVLLCPIIQLNNGRNYLLISSFAMLFASIIGNLINFYFINGGLNGLAVVYVISGLICLGIQAIHLFNKNNTLYIGSFSLNFKYMLSILKKSIPDVVLAISRFSRPICLNTIFLTFVGVMGITSYTIANNVLVFLYSVSSAIGAASIMLIKIYSSEMDAKECRNTLKVTARYILTVSVPIGIFVIIFSWQIAWLYTYDYEVLLLASFMLIFTGATLFTDSINRSIIKIFQATEHIWLAVFSNIVQIFLSPVLTALALTYLFGAKGIAYSILVCSLLSLLILVTIIILNNIFNKQTNSVINVFKDNDRIIFRSEISNKNLINTTIKNLDKFLQNNKISDNTRFKILLCVEELTYNILDYPKRSNEIFADIRIVIANTGVLLRLRDNSNKGDMKYLIKLLSNKENDADEYTNIGTRIVASMAKDIKYSYTIQYNNLIISI